MTDYLTQIMTTADLDARIDKDVLALELINECGRQTPRYMDSSFFATMATNFFKIKAREIKRNLDALALEYNPIEQFNVERVYDGTVDTDYGKTTTRTDNLTETFDMGDQTSTHYVSADNESGFQGRTKDEASSKTDSTRNTGTQTHGESGTDTVTDEHTETETGRRTAAQELLSSEFEVNKFNIYRMIALDFSDALMVAIY